MVLGTREGHDLVLKTCCPRSHFNRSVASIADADCDGAPDGSLVSRECLAKGVKHDFGEQQQRT